MSCRFGLHTPTPPRVVIGNLNTTIPRMIGDNVWIAGFPFGDLLAMDRKTDDNEAPNPAVTISRGMVTSLRRDNKGKLSTVQTDAAINPGNSGGAMVNSQGRLVGVVFAGIQGGQGLGFGISPNRVRDFIDRQAVKISFKPRMILSPPQPITVTVRPVLVGLGSDKGQVRLEGEDIETVTVDLQLTGNGLEGTIEFPDRIPGRLQPERYLATVSLSSTQAQDVILRRFSIKVSPNSFSKLQSMRDPARMMEDRKLFANEMRISEMAEEEQKMEPKEKRKLSDIAASITLQTKPSGSVVVNNNSIVKIKGFSLDHRRYRYVDDSYLRDLLQQYDLICLKILSLERGKMTHIVNPKEVLKEMKEEERVLGNQIVLANVLFCVDKEAYFVDKDDPESRPCAGTSIRNQVSP